MSTLEKDLATLLAKKFEAFARKAFRQQEGVALGQDAYLSYVCARLERVARGEEKRMLVLLPPRHLKTFLATICLTAWMLGADPRLKVMIVACNQKAAEDMTRKIRTIMKSEWYREAFPGTRISRAHSEVDDFETTAGGRVFATSIDGAVAGRGADVIIVDDPRDLKAARNHGKIEALNEAFDARIMSRRNNPQRARVLVVGHRIHKNDLFAQLWKAGGWTRIRLSLIARRTTVYEVDGVRWERPKGNILRPDAFDKTEVSRLRRENKYPSFELLFQQRPDPKEKTVRASDFTSLQGPLPRGLPVVLSIDPGQSDGPDHAYSVIQAWIRRGDDFILIDQWREQARYNLLWKTAKKFRDRHRPSVILIEATVNGTALCDALRDNGTSDVREIVPGRRSKKARLAAHIRTIRAGRVCLPAGADWRGEYIAEFVGLEDGKFSDQVDATTQLLDFMAGDPVLKRRYARGFASVAYGSGSSRFSRVDAASATPTPDAGEEASGQDAKPVSGVLLRRSDCQPTPKFSFAQDFKPVSGENGGDGASYACVDVVDGQIVTRRSRG